MSELKFSSPDGLTFNLRLPDGMAERIADSSANSSPYKPSFSQMERVYPQLPPLPPQHHLRRFGNPTPVGLGGFLLANSPATIMLLGWHGAGGGTGNESPAIGMFFYLGCLLEIPCGIGEWINGETFNAAVFLILGGYFGAAGAVLVAFYYAIGGYGNDAAADATYHESYAMLLISMTVLLLFFTIASIQLDVLPYGNADAAKAARLWGASFSAMGTVILWYLFLGSLLEAVDFPILLPVGDLSKHIKGRTEYLGRRRHKSTISS